MIDNEDLSHSNPAKIKQGRRRWFQFGLRTLLVVTGILCYCLAAATNRARQQRTALEALHKVGGRELFDWENPELECETHVFSLGSMYYRASGREYCKVGESPTPPGPAWLRHLLGDEYFQTVTLVDTSQHEIGDEPVTDATLQTIAHLESLRWLAIDHAQNVSDAGLAHVKSLPHLRRLFADDVPITNSGMKHLEGLTQLEYLSINSPHVTDEGLKSLRGLTRLKYLYLGNTKITDRGLELLKELKSLETLYVPDTDVSEAAARRFEQSKPKRQVIFSEPGSIG